MKNSRTVAIVVARMGSSRVPGKSLLDLCGKPVLWQVLEITKKIPGLDEICLATTDQKSDDPLIEVARECGVRVFRGDAENVLDRVYGAAVETKASVIVEIGGDCPLLDPAVIASALERFNRGDLDYLCNYEPPSYPEGMDINIVSMEAVSTAFRSARAPSQRIHPFSYLSRHKDKFRVGNIEMTPDLSTYHWSLDFPEDIEFIRAVYEKLYQPGFPIRLAQVLDLIRSDAHLAEINQKLIKPKSLHAFWNSPGIIRDMHADVAALGKLAEAAALQGRHTEATECYQEMLGILSELKRQSLFMSETPS